MSIINLNSLQKPARWNVQRGLVDGRFRNLWNDCVLNMPFWDVSVGPGARVEDVSGFGHHGTLGSGAGIWTASDRVGTPYGQGLLYRNQPGNSNQIADPSENRFDDISAASWEIIWKSNDLLTGTGDEDGLFTKYFTDTGYRSFRLYLQGDGAGSNEVVLQTSGNGTNFESEKTTTCQIQEEVWYHLIVTFDSGVNSVWLNGVEHALNDHTSQTSIFGGGAQLDIGTRRNNALSETDRLNGIVTLARMWRRALSQQEVRLLFESPWGMLRRAWPTPGLAIDQMLGSPIMVTPAAAVLDWSANNPSTGNTIEVIPEAAVLDWTANNPFAGAGAGPWIQAGTAAAGVQYFSVSGLTNGLEYELKLESVDTTGNVSAGTSPVSATPVEVVASPSVSLPRVSAPIYPPWTRT